MLGFCPYFYQFSVILLCNCSNNSGVIDGEWMGLSLIRNHLLNCWDCPFLLKWIGTFTLPLLLELPVGALVCSTKLLSSKVVLYFLKSTIWLCMEYCYHVRLGAPNCFRNGYVGLLILHLLLLLNLWLIMEI